MGLDFFWCYIDLILEFLTEMFYQGLGYKTILGYMSAIFASHDRLIPLLLGNSQMLASLWLEFLKTGCPNLNFVSFEMLKKC